MDKKQKEEFLKNEKLAVANGAGAVNNDGMIKVAMDGYQKPYPSPFLNLSDMQIPQTTLEIFKWCKYFYTFDPLISGAINALATFPVTEIHLEDEQSAKDKKRSDDIKLYNRVLFKDLNIYKLLIEVGIDYFLYGNCFIFGEMWTNPKTNEKEWKRVVRLDPSKMMIDYNPATGEKKYRWQVPSKIREIINKKAPKEEYDRIPDVIKQAVLTRKTIVLNPNNVYHLSRASDSMGDNVWGTPIVANVLKLLMYRNVLRQAQEAIAREHIVPMRIYYLEKTDNYNSFGDWNKVATDLAGQITQSVRDPNRKIVSPVPVNVLNVGGEGRSLLLTPEIDQVQSEILAGMNVPREFIFGGVSYSGSSISLKILENQFITYRLLLNDLVQNFIIKGMAKARGDWFDEDDDQELVTVKMVDLKMQDDVQQKQLIVQLNSSGKCSNDLMWKTMGIDPDKMKESIEKESLEAIELQTKVQQKQLEQQLMMMDLQKQVQLKQVQMEMEVEFQRAQLQQRMAALMGASAPQAGAEQQQAGAEQQATSPTSANGQQATSATSATSGQQDAQQTAQSNNQEEEINKEIQRIALQLVKMPKKDRDMALQKVSPSYRMKINQAVDELESAKNTDGNAQVDMRPMPEQRPPRRDTLK